MLFPDKKLETFKAVLRAAAPAAFQESIDNILGGFAAGPCSAAQ